MLGRRYFRWKENNSTCNWFSDGTLNPNGIRFGSAEIYSIVDQFNGEILDSLCVAQRNPTNGNDRVVLFLKVSGTCKREKEKNIDEYLFFIRIGTNLFDLNKI